MAQINTASLPAMYNAADAPVVAGYTMELSGTGWAEATNGNNFYLECGNADGNAVEQILNGKGDCVTGISPFISQFDTSIAGGLNDNATPAFKWIYSETTTAFYKVIAVLNDNLIQVEALYGTTPDTLYGCGTYGYAPVSVTISASGGSISLYSYQPGSAGASPFVIADGETKVIPIDIDLNGPVYITGDGAFSVNVKQPWQ